MAPRKAKTTSSSILIKYPVPVLASVTILSILFSMGAVWGNWVERVETLESQLHKVETKLDVILEVINKIDSKTS